MDSIEATVVYAQPDSQEMLPVKIPIGSTIRAAIERSRILERFSDIDLAVNRVGVYGVLRELSDMVQPGDRIEIYRPLIIDPKEARRLNAAAAKATK